jgi:hypothetical protein
MDSGIHPYTCNHYYDSCKRISCTKSINNHYTYWEKFFDGKKKKKERLF